MLMATSLGNIKRGLRPFHSAYSKVTGSQSKCVRPPNGAPNLIPASDSEFIAPEKPEQTRGAATPMIAFGVSPCERYSRGLISIATAEARVIDCAERD